MTTSALDPAPIHDVPAALATWFRAGHRWSRDELARMAAAVAASTVDDAIDAWFGPGWQNHGKSFVSFYRDGMNAARTAAGGPGPTTTEES